MEHKFTPGPWRTEIDNVFAGPLDNSVYVADCAPMGGPVDGLPEQIANARLIAAAPDFIATAPRAAEILRIAAKVIREYAPDALHDYDGTTCDGYCIADDCETEAEMLSLAIARATGEATSGNGGEG